MTIKLALDSSTGQYDFVVANGALQTGDQLESAVIDSLFCDARATPADLEEAGLPPGTDPRGYWADQFSVDGDKRGSKLWLLARYLRNDLALQKAKLWVEQALSWLLQDGVISSRTVATSWFEPGVRGRMRIDIEVTRPTGGSRRWTYLWDEVTGLELVA